MAGGCRTRARVIVPGAAAPPAGHGRVNLVLAPAGGKTALMRQDACTPLHVQGVLHGQGHMAEVVLLNVAGMILGGDRHEVRVEVRAGGHALLRTVGATKLHRAEPAVPAIARVDLHVGPGALLEYLPGALIPHAGAWLEQETSVDVATGGHAIAAEILAPGRFHAGETFAYHRLALDFAATCAGNSLLTDSLMLEPSNWQYGREALFGRYTHLATLYAIGAQADACLAHELHALVQRFGVHGGATLGHRDTVVLRALANGTHALTELVHAATALCRRHFLTLSGTEVTTANKVAVGLVTSV